MEPVTETVFSPAKVARLDNDYSLCIICQTKTTESLVVSPNVHEHVLLENLLHTVIDHTQKSVDDLEMSLGRNS